MPLLASNLALFNEEEKAGRQSLRNHLQKVDDSDTDSVIKQMISDTQQSKGLSHRSNRQSTTMSHEKRFQTSKIETGATYLEREHTSEALTREMLSNDMKTGGAMISNEATD